MARPLRLHHADPGQYFIIDGSSVFADADGDGRISTRDRYAGDLGPALIAAARHFDAYYDVPYPGAKSVDPQVTSGGRLNLKEVSAFSSTGVIAKRPDLLGHLDFFDRRSGDGMITLSENYRSWRDLGYGGLKSLVLTLGSAVVFGRAADGFGIDVERIADKRPKGSTRIYGPDGNVDQARLREFAAVFGSADVLTHDELRAAIAAKVTLGAVPARQFESLFLLTGRANGRKTVTKAQFLGLFDNSLFWTVASMPQPVDGRRL
jgi:Caleosin related protein